MAGVGLARSLSLFVFVYPSDISQCNLHCNGARGAWREERRNEGKKKGQQEKGKGHRTDFFCASMKETGCGVGVRGMKGKKEYLFSG